VKNVLNKLHQLIKLIYLSSCNRDKKATIIIL